MDARIEDYLKDLGFLKIRRSGSGKIIKEPLLLRHKQIICYVLISHLTSRALGEMLGWSEDTVHWGLKYIEKNKELLSKHIDRVRESLAIDYDFGCLDDGRYEEIKKWKGRMKRWIKE